MTVSTVSCSTSVVWQNFKDLLKALQSGNAAEVAQLLERNRKYLLTPLAGSPSNASKKSQINKGDCEPIETDEGPKTLSKSIIAEIGIISSLYDLDEHRALELLWSAEHRLAQFPGLTRGLVAVLLYWDGRNDLLHSLKNLCQSSFGNTNMNAGIDHVAAQFLDSLWNENIFGSLMKAYSSLSIEGELDKLAKQRGLGDAEHKRSVRNLIISTKMLLAESIYCLAFHERMSKSNMKELVEFIAKMEPNGEGTISESDCTLLFTVIHMIEVEHTDHMDSLSALPILSDTTRISLLHTKIYDSPDFKNAQILSIVQLAWSMTLSGLTQLPLSANLETLTECDDQCMDKALQAGAFTFLKKLVDSDAIQPQNELVIRQIHKLITDIIVLMPLKLKELRKGSTPSLWIELADLITAFYKKFSSFGFHAEFWNAFQGLKPTHRCLALQDFIRIDMVSAELYVPTVKMLEALSQDENSSSSCFRLLRQAAGNLSWERIFESLKQYSDHLRVETGPENTNWSQQAGISPEETSALIAVIKLTSTVAENDPSSRQVILEQQAWRVPIYLMQLFRCGIAPSLKAACFDCLRTLIGNEGAAASLWVSMDGDHVLQGIIQEVERIESQEERYPLTIAFCNLIQKLCEYPLPLNFGAGARSPGVTAYIDFALSNVLLRLDSFSYKEPAQKWEITIAVLDTIALLLASYTPSQDDFNTESTTHPGFGIFRKLLSDSALFRKLIDIMSETGSHLEEYPSTYNEGLLKAGQKSLGILSTAIRGSKVFMNNCRDAGAGIILTPIHQLLASINPKTQKADFIRQIAKLVGFASDQPLLAQSALEILLDLSKRYSSGDMLSLMVSGTSSHREQLMKSFWQCLELTEEEAGSCRITVLKLILQYIDCRSISFSHFLLGYPLQAPLSSASLQDPGILNAPKTVLHALLALLSSSDDDENEELLELGYETIYRLCSNTETSAPVLRYLRSTYDFVFDRLQGFKEPLEEISVEKLRSIGWLLKLSALELHCTNQAKQRSITARLVQLILQRGDVRRIGQTKNTTLTIGELSALGADHSTSLAIMSMFRVLDLTDAYPEPPNFDLLDIGVVEQLATQSKEDGVINLLKVHNSLQGELTSQVDSNGQIPARLEAEVTEVLRWLQRININQKLTIAKVHFLEGWRQLLEVCIAGPMDIVPGAVRVSILQEILQEILSCVNRPESMTSLTSMLSTLAMAIMTHLRISLKQQQDPNALHETSSATFLDGTLSEMTATPIIPSSTLLPSIGEGLIQWAIGAQSQRVRSHLYASLLNYFQLQPDFQVQTDMHASRLFNDTIVNSVPISNSAARILNLYGTSIMQITCQDAVDGHSVTRTLAYALLDSIMRRDGDKKWLTFMREKGYLKQVISSLLLEDGVLVESLQGNGNLASVYVHESRMSLLSTLARHRVGARALVETGIIQQLSDAKFLDMRPVVSNMGDGQGNEEKIHRYRMLLFPVLRLIMCLQSTLGVGNDNIQQHVFYFVYKHFDALTNVIFAYNNLSTDKESLEEIHLITSVLCIVAGHDFHDTKKDIDDSDSFTNLEMQQNKIRRLLFALQSTYILTESWVEKTERSAYLAAQRTSANITMMITQIILNTYYKNKGSSVNIVLSPILSPETLSTSEDLPLGVIIKLLKEATADFVETIQTYTLKQRNLENVAALPAVTLDELAGVSNDTLESGERLSLAQKQQKAKDCLQKQLSLSEKIMQIQHMQLESASFIVWKHVEFYLSKAPKKNRSILFGNSDTGDANMSAKGLTNTQLTELKQGLSSALNETTIKRLTDAEVQYFQAKGADENVSRDFIHPVAYRIQKIVELNRA